MTARDLDTAITPSTEMTGGAPAVIARLFDEHAAIVFAYLARRLGRDHAEDATAETFRIAVERFATYDPALGEPLPWLLGIATNVVRRSWRDEERRLRAIARVPRLAGDVDGPSSSADDLVDIGAALATLSRGDRDVVVLIAWEDLTYEQVATALGVPIGTVRSRLHRARRQLREILGIDEEDDDE